PEHVSASSTTLPADRDACNPLCVNSCVGLPQRKTSSLVTRGSGTPLEAALSDESDLDKVQESREPRFPVSAMLLAGWTEMAGFGKVQHDHECRGWLFLRVLTRHDLRRCLDVFVSELNLPIRSPTCHLKL